MDPWYYHVHKIPRVLANKGYMDDNATGGVGLRWLAPAERLITSFASAGFVVLMHSCYRTEILSSDNCSLPIISSGPHVVAGYPSLLSSLPSPLPDAWLRLQSGSRVVTIHSSQLSISPSGVRCPSSPHLLSFLHLALSTHLYHILPGRLLPSVLRRTRPVVAMLHSAYLAVYA